MIEYTNVANSQRDLLAKWNEWTEKTSEKKRKKKSKDRWIEKERNICGKWR